MQYDPRPYLQRTVVRRLPKLPKLPKSQRLTATLLKLRPNVWLVTVIGVLVAACQAVLIWASKAGLMCDAAVLAVLTIIALRSMQARAVAIGAAIIPIAQLLLASIIIKTPFIASAVFYVTLLILGLVYRYLFTLDAPVEQSKIEARGYNFGLPLMFILGEAAGLIGYALLRHQYYYRGMPLPIVALASIVFAFGEEMVLRGLIQQQASRIAHPAVAAMLSALIYIALNTNHQTMLTLLAALIVGPLLSWTYYHKQNLLLTTALNAAAKLTYIGLVAGFILR